MDGWMVMVMVMVFVFLCLFCVCVWLVGCVVWFGLVWAGIDCGLFFLLTSFLSTLLSFYLSVCLSGVYE